MRVSSFNTYQPYFRSNQAPVNRYEYRIEPFAGSTRLRRKSGGERPNIASNGVEKSMRVSEDGDFYEYKLPTREITEFSVYDGDDTFSRECDSPALHNRTIRALQEQRGIPECLIISDKKPVVGRLVFINGLSNMEKHFDEPTIVVNCGEWSDVVGGVLPKETVGYIGFPGAFDGVLSHNAQRYKQLVPQFQLLIDEDDRNELLKLGNDQIVEVGVENGHFYVKPVDKNGKLPERPTIPIPHLRYCDKILTSKECTPDVIGNKAVNLRKLEKMAEEGKINAVIPPFIALPEGFLKYFRYHDLYNKYGFEIVDRIENVDKEYMRTNNKATPEEMELHKDVADAVAERMQLFNKYRNKMYSKLVKTAKENGVVGTVIFRSCFNDEDLPYFANAGGYTSKGGWNLEKILKNGKNAGATFALNLDYTVLISKFNQGPRELRRAFNIPEEDVQVGVIVQKQIDTNAAFTIYTDDGTGDLKIDLKVKSDGEKWEYCKRTIFSHMFTYHRDTGELTYDTIQTELDAGANFDMDNNMKELDPIASDLSGNEELFKLLKSAAEDAIRVEEEFGGAPQDIEGCVINSEDGSAYDGYAFVQSRNIIR